MAKVYAFLTEGFELVEALAVVDVLRRASIEVVTVSIIAGFTFSLFWITPSEYVIASLHNSSWFTGSAIMLRSSEVMSLNKIWSLKLGTKFDWNPLP